MIESQFKLAQQSKVVVVTIVLRSQTQVLSIMETSVQLLSPWSICTIPIVVLDKVHQTYRVFYRP